MCNLYSFTKGQQAIRDLTRERLELGHYERDQLALAIGRQQIEGVDGEANVSHAVNDHDAAYY